MSIFLFFPSIQKANPRELSVVEECVCHIHVGSMGVVYLPTFVYFCIFCIMIVYGKYWLIVLRIRMS